MSTATLARGLLPRWLFGSIYYAKAMFIQLHERYSRLKSKTELCLYSYMKGILGLNLRLNYIYTAT